jgi:hypothetical protein
MSPDVDPWSFVDFDAADELGPAVPGELASVLRALETLTAEVAALRASSRVTAREALTPREAARALGVDRSRVLAPAIARGDVKAVKVNGGTRIPRTEIERIAETGFRVLASAAQVAAGPLLASAATSPVAFAPSALTTCSAGARGVGTRAGTASVA